MRRAAWVAVVLTVFVLGWFLWPSETTAPKTLVEEAPTTESPRVPLPATPIAEDAPTASVLGRAAFADGRPAEGVEVCVRIFAPVGDGTFRDSNQRRCTRTDARGDYVVDALPGGIVPALSGALAGYVVERPGDTAPIEPGEQRTVDLTVRPIADFARFVVRVDDEGGGPVVGARVTGTRSKDDLPCLGTHETDANGVATLYCQPGEHRIFASSPGYIRTRFDGPAPGEATLVLRPGGTISGRLTGPGFDPAGAYHVRARVRRYGGHGTKAREGGFTFSGLEPGTYALTAMGEGTFGGADVTLGAGEIVSGLEIEMQPATTARFTIRRKGGVCERPWVEMTRRERPRARRVMMERDDAPVVIEALPPGTYDVEVKCGGSEEDIVDEIVVADEPIERSYVVPANFSVIVRVIDDRDRPVEGAKLFMNGSAGLESGRTDASGTFDFAAVAGQWKISATHDVLGAAEVKVALDEHTTAPIVLRLDRGRVVRGVVMDTERRPVANARVVLSVIDVLGDVLETTSGADGRFTFSQIESERVHVAATSGKLGSEEVEVVATADAEPIELVLRPLNGRVFGRVITHDGIPAGRTRVRLQRGQRSLLALDGYLAETATRDDGTFEFTHVAPAKYDLDADHETAGIGSADDIDVDVAVELRLSGRGSIEGTVVDASGPVAAFELKTNLPRKPRPLERRFEGGRFRLDDLIAGRYRIVVSEGARSVEEWVEVPAGGRASVKMRLPPRK
ncbi:MAG: carboxypeptidase-like regulatory domain-containing protein [Deltaproteobacteria bacterium]